MRFIGLAGGYQAAITLMASALNFIFSGNNQGFEMLSQFFLINSDSYRPRKQFQWINGFRRSQISGLNRVIFGTALRLTPFLGRCSKTDRMKRVLDLVDNEVAQNLDLRTIIRERSYLIAIIRALISPENYKLLTLQRNSKYLSIRRRNDKLKSLLFQSDSDAESKASYLMNQMMSS